LPDWSIYRPIAHGPKRTDNMVPIGDVERAGISYSFQADMPIVSVKKSTVPVIAPIPPPGRIFEPTIGFQVSNVVRATIGSPDVQAIRRALTTLLF